MQRKADNDVAAFQARESVASSFPIDDLDIRREPRLHPGMFSIRFSLLTLALTLAFLATGCEAILGPTPDADTSVDADAVAQPLGDGTDVGDANCTMDACL